MKPAPTLKRQLTRWFLILAIAPMLGVGALAYWAGTTVLQNHIGGQLAGTAFDTVDKLDRIFFEREGDVSVFAGSEEARSRDSKRVRALMDRMVGAYAPMYRVMVMADRSGKVLAVNRVGPKGERLDSASLEGTDVSREPWFHATVS